MEGGWGKGGVEGGSLVRVSNTAGFGERDSCHERLNHAQLPQLSLQRPPRRSPPLSLRQFASAASLLFLFLFLSFGALKLLGCGLYFAHSWVFFSSACIITVVRSVFVCLVSWRITLEMIYFIFFFPSNTFFFFCVCFHLGSNMRAGSYAF